LTFLVGQHRKGDVEKVRIVSSIAPVTAELSPAACGFPAHWPSIAVEIWDRKYRFKHPEGVPVEARWSDTVQRVAKAAASVEVASARAGWAATFASAMSDFAFLPAGRILAGAGTKRRVTLFNCFVLGRIDDDLGAIFDQVKQAVLTMQQGGGIGHDFSTLRPRGALVKSIGADASGPVAFMDVWDAMCRTIMSAGNRRGAMMATLRCDHPDIEAFISAKREPGRLRNFNLSVLVTDAFVAAVRADAPWDLVFEGRVYRTLQARALWDTIMRATYDVAEPGVIFIDRVNALNTLGYCETIHATNPCGEQPLPPYGACLLGSINLAALVLEPFTARARLDEARLTALTATAVRFLDNVIDVSAYPLKAQRAEALAKRRLGLGVTGLASALAALGVRYGTPSALGLVDRWLATLKASAYRASAGLAAEKGAFPLYDAAAVLTRPALVGLPDDVRAAITASGLRNGLLTSIAPTGTISLLAGNVSSGIEPVFGLAYDRRVLLSDGQTVTERVEDQAYAAFRRVRGAAAALPEAFVTADQLTPGAHLAMQAAAQRHIDSAISKTINCPADIGFETFADIYLNAYDLGLKGVTTYRPNAVTGAVLSQVSTATAAPGPMADTALLPPVVNATVGPVLAVATRGREPPNAIAASRDASSSLASASLASAGLAPGSGSPSVIYMTQPLMRDAVLEGFTYKLKWPGSDHAMYITINDTESAGRRRPFEIFINSKNLEHYAWTLALTRMISAIFRRGGDVAFVVNELKAVFDPQGGRWMDGRYVPSLLAAIGEVIETHLRRTGFLPETASADWTEPWPAQRLAQSDQPTEVSPVERDRHPPGDRPSLQLRPSNHDRRSAPPDGPGQPPASAKICPRCSAQSYIRQEGCWTCTSCGHSSCG
jgi:ribonucleoside-diphosphate reductase alpha chain